MKVLWGLMFLAAVPAVMLAADFGFLEQNLWVSSEPFFAGESTRIYSVIFNGGSEDIIGTITFYDSERVIGETEFSLAGGGRLRDVWIDFQADYGEHDFSAAITSAARSLASGESEAIGLGGGQSSRLNFFVDRDTDGDRMGDREDEDDDNDGIMDVEDLAPLTVNAPAPEEDLAGEHSLGILAEVTESAAPAVSAAGNVLEEFRQKHAAGLVLEKERVQFVLDQEKETWRTGQMESIRKQNQEAEDLNSASGEDTMRLRDMKDAMPPLSLKRVAHLIYLGVITFAIAIFQYKLLFYTILGLIGLKIIWSLARKVFRR